jgi:hypothetical protein
MSCREIKKLRGWKEKATALFEKEGAINHKFLPNTSTTIAATLNLLAIAALTLGSFPTGM